MTQDSPSRKLDQYIVRFPDGMRDMIRDAAAKNNRSMNAEIIARLEQSFSLTLLERDEALRDLAARIEALEHHFSLLADRPQLD